MPKLSMIMPAYNAAETCKIAVESVINNNQYDLELLVIDDGSKDNTYQICVEMHQVDPRVKIYKKENGGVSSARNLGIKLAQGEYIGFLDADDTIDELYMATIFPLLSKGADIVVFGYTIIQNGKVAGSRFMKKTEDLNELRNELLGSCQCLNSPWNKIFKRNLIKYYFNESKRMGEDLEFCCSYLKEIQSCIVISDPLYRYKVDSNESLTKKMDLLLPSIAEDMRVLFDFTSNVGIDTSVVADKFYQRTEGILGGIAAFREYKKAVHYILDDPNFQKLLKALTPRKKKNNLLRIMLKSNQFHLLYLYLKCKRISRNIIRRC